MDTKNKKIFFLNLRTVYLHSLFCNENPDSQPKLKPLTFLLNKYLQEKSKKHRCLQCDYL